MDKKDYYDVLGVDKNADDRQIKSAFRKLAKQYHPDVNKESDAEGKFKEAQEAYAVLSDSQKRKQYDQFGHAAFNNNGGGYGGFNGGGGSAFGDFDFSDIFGDIFGGAFGGGSSRGRNANAPRKGSDMEMNMTVTFDEAAFGTEKEITLNLDVECDDCGGKGGHGEETCSECHGSGTVTVEQRSMLGTFLTKTTCPHCHGKGKTYKETCSTCHGNGRVKKPTDIKVSIPAGIATGHSLRLQGKGGAGFNGGPNGDLYINFRVKDHAIFNREEDDIYLELPVNIVDATLGTKVEIPTLYGKVELNIPAGTQPGDKHRLKGKGIENIYSKRKGNMYVIVKVEIPKKLNKEQKKIFESLSKTKFGKKNIFDKFKDYMQ